MLSKTTLSLALHCGAFLVALITSTTATAAERVRLSVSSMEDKAELNVVLGCSGVSEVLGNAPGTKGSPAPAVYRFTVPWSNASVKMLAEAFANKPLEMQADYIATNSSGADYVFMSTQLKGCLITEVQITDNDLTVGASGGSQAQAGGQSQAVLVTFTVLSPSIVSATVPRGQQSALTNVEGANVAFLSVPDIPGDGISHKDRGRRVGLNLVMKVPCRVVTAPVPEVKPTGRWDVTSAEVWSDAGTSSPAYQERLAKRTKIASATLTLWGVTPEGSDMLVTAINLNGLQLIAGERTFSAREATEKWWLDVQTVEFIGQTASENAVLGAAPVMTGRTTR